MTKDVDPTKDPEFKWVLGNLLKAPPKLQSVMKLKTSDKSNLVKRTAAKKKGANDAPSS